MAWVPLESNPEVMNYFIYLTFANLRKKILILLLFILGYDKGKIKTSSFLQDRYLIIVC